MDQGTVLDIGREALTVVATIAGPMLGVALVIGLLVGMTYWPCFIPFCGP
jgi:flagellar biosynthesis protein FliQ